LFSIHDFPDITEGPSACETRARMLPFNPSLRKPFRFIRELAAMGVWHIRFLKIMDKPDGNQADSLAALGKKQYIVGKGLLLRAPPVFGGKNGDRPPFRGSWPMDARCHQQTGPAPDKDGRWQHSTP
jgi:hypothetical protein